MKKNKNLLNFKIEISEHIPEGVIFLVPLIPPFLSFEDLKKYIKDNSKKFGKIVLK